MGVKPDIGGRAVLPGPVFRTGLGRRIPAGYLRLGPLVAIPAVLAQCGCDLKTVLDGLGIPTGAFDHPDNALPYRTVSAMVGACATATAREDFGLLIAGTVGPSDLGLVGFLMKQAATVGEALSCFVRYIHLHDSGAVLQLSKRGGVAVLAYAILEHPGPGADVVHDGAIAIGYSLMKALCGPRFAALEVTLARRPPSVPARYERYFGVPVRFDAEQSAILFSESWLTTPLLAPDPALRRMLEEEAMRLVAPEHGGVTEDVRRLLRGCFSAESSRLDDVSALLRVSKRTLERRLEREGTSFHRLVEEARYEVARQLLEDTALPITQIALALKYSEASAFSRAFKGWAGASPRAWRAANGRRT